MSELNREQHELLAGSFSDDAFFGGFITQLGGMFMPLKAEQTNGNHFTQLVNLLDSENRRLANCFQGYVYKDSMDTVTQFSVKPFSFQFRGLVGTFSGVVAQGDLNRSVNNMIWADLTNAPTITIAFGSSWPTTPHLKLGTINMPSGTGHWFPSDLTFDVGSQAATVHRGCVAALRKDFTFGSGATFPVATVPADALVVPVSIIVDVAFAGTSPTLSVGDSGTPTSLFNAIDLTTIGRHDTSTPVLFASQTDLIATLSGSPTAGTAHVVMEQW